MTGVFRKIDTEMLMDITYGISSSVVYHILIKKMKDKSEIDQIIEDCYSVLFRGIKTGNDSGS